MKKARTKAAPPDTALRQAICDAARAMNALGINQGTSGNLSARTEGGILITPSALPYDAMAPGDIVYLGFDGTTDGHHRPSTEWRFHLDILRDRPDLNAVVHAHPIHATALAIHGRGIPAVHYMVAAAGGADIRCAPYATFGTAELSDFALAAMEGRDACLLAHHGMIAAGRSLDKAMWLAVEVETLARQYHAALALGEPPVLPDDEIDRVLAKFANYGRKD